MNISFNKSSELSTEKANVSSFLKPGKEGKKRLDGIKNLTNLASVEHQLKQGKYVAPHILARYEKELKALGYDADQLSGRATLLKAMGLGKTCFAKVKPANKEHLQGIRKDKQPFPKKI